MPEALGDLAMTFNDVLNLVLCAFEDDDRSFDRVEINRWPDGSFESMVAAGLLHRAGGRMIASCPECEGSHAEEVFTESCGDEKRYYIDCPDLVRVEVTPDDCERWEPCKEGVAEAIKVAMQLSSAFKELYPQRLWRLGRFQWNGRSREVLLARGLCRPDARNVMAKVPPAGKALVLVPEHVPDDRGWPGRIPAVVSISDYLVFESNNLQLDGGAMLDAIQDADQQVHDQGHVSLDVVAKKKVKHTVKECIDERVFKEEVVDAVIRFGGVLQAIDELKAEGKEPPSKATIYRWVNKNGGIESLRSKPEWGSMVDLKMSHPGKRAEKYVSATK